MNDFFVIFTENNARIYKGKPERSSENILVNPDLSRVKGIPPHLWKRVGNEIHPMSDDESLSRLKHIDNFGVSNAEAEPYKPKIHTMYVNRFIYKPMTILNKLALFAAGFMVASLMWLHILINK